MMPDIYNLAGTYGRGSLPQSELERILALPSTCDLDPATCAGSGGDGELRFITPDISERMSLVPPRSQISLSAAGAPGMAYQSVVPVPLSGPPFAVAAQSLFEPPADMVKWIDYLAANSQLTTNEPVAKGETFGSIAKRYGVGPKELMAANPEYPERNLPIGVFLKMPTDMTTGTYGSEVALPPGEPASSGSSSGEPASGGPSPYALFQPGEITPAAGEQLAVLPGAQAPGAHVDSLMSMYEKYLPKTDYSAALKAAEADVAQRRDDFNKAILASLQNTGEKPNLAEMYFRLAAAFAEPTKTGHFTESLGKASTVMAEHQKEKRLLAKEKLLRDTQLKLDLRKLDLAESKENLSNLRTLYTEDQKTKRETMKEMMKEYINSGKPLSEAGRIAKDMGFTPGTPEYQVEVTKNANMLVQKQMAQLQGIAASTAASAATAQATASREARLLRQEARLSPQELDLKIETEDKVAVYEAGLAALEKALKLNPNTFDTSLGDTAQRMALGAIGSNNTTLHNTNTQENLLAGQAVAQLKALVGGNPTEGERQIILNLQGIGAKSKEERATIINNAIAATNVRLKKARARLENINAGRYRQTTGDQ